MRSNDEWRGSTDDTPPPPRVRLRVYEAFGKRCAKCRLPIDYKNKWDLDHAVALANGGLNIESNLQALCAECHSDKTKDDVAAKAKGARIRKRNAGIRKRRKTIPGRKFNGDPIPSRWVG